MKRRKKIFIGVVLALVLTVSTVGMVADAAGTMSCSHSWTAEEDAGTKTTSRYSHRTNDDQECHVVEYEQYINIRCRSCGEIVGQRTETHTKHSISHTP